jgi:hypothetical protein
MLKTAGRLTQIGGGESPFSIERGFLTCRLSEPQGISNSTDAQVFRKDHVNTKSSMILDF